MGLMLTEGQTEGIVLGQGSGHQPHTEWRETRGIGLGTKHKAQTGQRENGLGSGQGITLWRVHGGNYNMGGCGEGRLEAGGRWLPVAGYISSTAPAPVSTTPA